MPKTNATHRPAKPVHELRSIPLCEIELHPLNPRPQKGDELEIERLGVSLAESQLQPAIVRRKPGKRKDNYELIAGSRRFRAAKAQGLGTLLCIVREFTSEREVLLCQADENLQRKDLDPISLATQLLTLATEEPAGAGMTHSEIALRFGKRSPSWVGNFIGMLRLPENWRRRIRSGELSPRKAKALLAYADCPEILAAVAAAEKQDPKGFENADAWWKEVPAIAEAFGKLSSTTAARRKNGTAATADSKSDVSTETPSRRAAPLKVFDDDVSGETPIAKTAAKPGRLNYGDVISMLLKYANSRADLELIRDHAQSLLDELGAE